MTTPGASKPRFAAPLLLGVVAACSDSYSGGDAYDGHYRDAAALPEALDAASSPSDAEMADGANDSAPIAPYPWRLPVGFPEPVVPVDNPMTVGKVELG